MADSISTQSLQKGTEFFRQCRVCLEPKSLKDFEPTVISPRSGTPLYRHICYACARTARSRKMDSARTSIENYATMMVKWSKDRARIKSFAFSLTEGWIVAQWDKQKGRCFYSGEPMELQSGPRLVTVERLDVGKGYEPENCVLACLRINMMRASIPMGEFVWWCHRVADKSSVEPSPPQENPS